MGQRFGVRKIVRRHEFNLGIIQSSPDDVTPDTAEAVDTYLDWHIFLF
jgi:hypothetical protein